MINVGDHVECAHDAQWQKEHRERDLRKARQLGQSQFMGNAAAYLHLDEAYVVGGVLSNGGLKLRGYPQDLRNVWAEANAAKGTAIWRLVDARSRLACLSLRTIRGRLAPGVSEQDVLKAQAEVTRLEAEKDAAVSQSLAAREALDVAEELYYAGTPPADNRVRTPTDVAVTLATGSPEAEVRSLNHE